MIKNYFALYLSDSINIAFLNTGLEKRTVDNTLLVCQLCQLHELPFTSSEGKDVYRVLLFYLKPQA